MTVPSIKFALCQLNLTTGDFEGNFRKAEKAVLENDADVYVFPECQVANHPSGDLYRHFGYLLDAEKATGLYRALSETSGKTIVFGGTVGRGSGKPTNAVIAVQGGQVSMAADKVHLSAEEMRTFSPGEVSERTLEIQLRDGGTVALGFCVGDDIRHGDLMDGMVDAEISVCIASSPFFDGKAAERRQHIADWVWWARVPLVYVNQSGGNDEMVWDGRSTAFDASGRRHEVKAWAETVDVVTFEKHGDRWLLEDAPALASDLPARDAELYVAACVGLRDYLAKTGFGRAVIGLSGGADSALVALMAADVLGAQNVDFVMMPTNFTSGTSNELAMDLANGLGALSRFAAIQPLFDAYKETLSSAFGDTQANVAEENLQAQIRGDILSWYSNKFGAMILSTGNKSEVAMGYSTLYGDMRGGFNPLKDLYKTEVFDLLEMRLEVALGNRADFVDLFSTACGRAPARLRKTSDSDGPGALRKIIDRPPSAELADGQLDSDSLPDYAILDKVLRAMVDSDKILSNDQVASKTKQPIEMVEEVRRRMRIMEYKRFQSCPGPKVHRGSFTAADWRFPMASNYRE